MKIGFDLVLEQRQTLVLTPELIQAIRILQYNAQELDIFISEQLLANPMLESQPDDGSHDDQDRLEGEMDDSKADDGSHNPDDVDSDFDWQEYLQQRDYSDVSYGPDLATSGRDNSYSFTERASFGTQGAPDSQDVTLEEHLMFQLQFVRLSKETLAAARYIIESLDGNGYLTQSPEEIADATGISMKNVDRALQVIRKFDPIGVAAGNLSECLAIQLRERGVDDPVIYQIVEKELDNIAANRLQIIAKRYGLKVQEVKDIAGEIRQLDPKPGSGFSEASGAAYVIPDVIVEKVGSDYVINMSDVSSPRLIISPYYRKLLSEGKEDPVVSQFLAGRLDSARWLIKSIEHRKQTIYNVVSAVVRYQKDFLDYGRKGLRPLTLKRIADEIGIHESTVSRAVNGKYMQTPWGVFELRYFFTSGVAGGSPDGVAADGVKARIAELIESENKSSPLSDQSIAERLISDGIEISRRTVAKYRDDMKVPSSTMRRR